MSEELQKIFYPKSIAIIGASSKKKTLGHELVRNLLNFGYEGKIFPVNPKAEFVHSIKAYKSLADIHDDIDLVIIMVAKQFVIQAIEDCHRKKIKSVILITAGFKETGEEGEELEEQLIKKINEYKIRLVGPNCMGLINTKPEINMNCTFVQGEPHRGGIGFISQSGALGAAVLKIIKKFDIGLSQFISIGNKADISENTILEYWKNNSDIKVITLYLESLSDSRKFMTIAKATSKIKPIIAIKAAKTTAGMKAASSHTGALASTDTIVNAIFEQSGVIRVDSTEQMFDLAKSFDRTFIPTGNRLGILTNAGGPAILTVDEAEKSGLIIPTLEENTIKSISEFASPEASLHNPVDLLPAANAEAYGKATEIMLQDNNIDALIVILGPPLMYDTIEIGKYVCEAANKFNKTAIFVFMSQDENISELSKLLEVHPPIFNSPESAARVIGEMHKYKLIKEKISPEESIESIIKETSKQKVSDILNRHKGKGEFYLDFDDVYEILSAYELPIVESLTAKDTKTSVDYAEKVGFPVVIKSVGKELLHKSDAGGVILDIKNKDELIQAENKVISNLKEKNLDKKLEGFLIQPYIKGGIETILGVIKDKSAGHLIMFGLGGVLVEIFKDVKFRLHPLSSADIKSLYQDIKGYEILKGVRGNLPVNFKYLEENLTKLSNLINDFPEFTEIDFNPFILKPEKENCKILDARMKIRI